MQICKDLNVSDFLTLKKLPLFLRMHINGCSDCQNAIAEYSQRNFISDSVFGKPFEKQKLLWFGSEFLNSETTQIKVKDKKGSSKIELENFSELELSEGKSGLQKLIFFCFKNKKWILTIGYVSILIPILQITFGLF
ncbi:hypothetical protein DLM78_15025 [Leptospira stimsonii]|uniref:Zinc-finger domain-containing protein n=1 Tax=Leptospira stimsonii TaxID=2202203 RepID=A0A8B3CPA0_9LEPT|nr:hypothetical protein DLM78_15025 [Leptospira stimsonii]